MHGVIWGMFYIYVTNRALLFLSVITLFDGYCCDYDMMLSVSMHDIIWTMYGIYVISCVLCLRLATSHDHGIVAMTYEYSCLMCYTMTEFLSCIADIYVMGNKL